MDGKVLVIVMGFILLGLYLASNKYRKKEKILNVLEGRYFKAVLAAKENESLKEEALEVGKEYAGALGLNEEETHAMLEQDMGL